jgi:hypothetical protein
MPSTNLDDEWIQMVVKARKMEESFLAEDKLLRGHQDNLQERKSNPIKGKETATRKSSREGGAFNEGLTLRFDQPKDMMNLTPAEKEEWGKRLRDITTETLRERRNKRFCLRCGGKNYTQWYCPESQLKAAVASAKSTSTVQPQKRKWEDQPRKVESAPPDKKKKAAAIISMGGRIYELESELMDVDD